MANLDEQLEALRVPPIVTVSPLGESLEDIEQRILANKPKSSLLGDYKTLEQEVAEGDKDEAIAWAAWMGTLDTVRGVKQLVGWGEEQEDADQSSKSKNYR